MRVIIFEGIPTSGKSTLIKLLQQPLKAEVFSEEQTHEPIMQDRANTNLPFFQSLLSKINKQAEVVVFDRLYLTQAFRAGVNLDTYSVVEKELSTYASMTIFLSVDADAITERILKTAEQRGTAWGDYSSWNDYFKTKGQTPDEIAGYYIKQQNAQLKLLEQSKLPYKIFNTTNHDYEKIAEEIIQMLNT